IHRVRRARRLVAVALALSLALPFVAFGPPSAAAQAPGPRLVVEQPSGGSQIRGQVEIGGWAVDTASATGTGIAPDSVEIWLGPAGGQKIGDAGYGDPRTDVVQSLGNNRYVLSGFRYFWNSCDAPPGSNVLTITARSSAVPARTATATIPVTIGSCALQLGETVSGQILTSGQADEWTFDGTAGERGAITLDGIGGRDTLLELV